MASRFVCACLPSVIDRVNPVLSDHPQDIAASAVNAFLRRHCSRFLSSIGVCMNKTKPDKNHLAVRRYQSAFDRIRGAEYLRDTELFIDNAGFQVQLGQLPTTHLDDYVQDFHEFLLHNHEDYDYSFTLDLAPGTDNSVFASPREIFDYNLRSYRMAAALPDAVREKISCILHFRGPHLYMAWQRLLFGERLADSFLRYATGGLAQTRGLAGMPVFSYAIPLARLVLYAKQRGLTALPFHVLGESQPEDVLIHALVEKFVQDKHGLAVTITHDSSNIFRQNMGARVAEIPDLAARAIRKVALHSGRMGFKDPGHASRRTEFYDAVNAALGQYGLGPFSNDTHPFYVGRQTTHFGYFALLIVALWTYDLTNDWMGEAAEDLYPLIRDGQVPEFKQRFVATLRPYLPPTKAANLPGLANQITAGLDLLANPDPDLLERLVKQHLRDDEAPVIRSAALYF